jgi:hypothetical protein
MESFHLLTLLCFSYIKAPPRFLRGRTSVGALKKYGVKIKICPREKIIGETGKKMMLQTEQSENISIVFEI